MELIRAFVIGGLICVVGQILIDKTKLSSARILVMFVVLGCILTGLGLYKPLVDFAGAGATIPLPGFGYALTTGIKQAIDEKGLGGIFTGALSATSAGITAAIVFSTIAALVFEPKPKKAGKRQ